MAGDASRWSCAFWSLCFRIVNSCSICRASAFLSLCRSWALPSWRVLEGRRCATNSLLPAGGVRRAVVGNVFVPQVIGGRLLVVHHSWRRLKTLSWQRAQPARTGVCSRHLRTDSVYHSNSVYDGPGGWGNTAPRCGKEFMFGKLKVAPCFGACRKFLKPMAFDS
jgi:hypothetical protein